MLQKVPKVPGKKQNTLRGVESDLKTVLVKIDSHLTDINKKNHKHGNRFWKKFKSILNIN